MIYKLVGTVTTEPVSLEQARLQIGLDAADTSSDTMLTALITAAREYVENYTNRVLVSTTWQAFMDSFDTRHIELFKLPVTAIASVKYYNSSNLLTTLDTTKYVTDLISEPARLLPISGYDWPDTYDRPNAVEIDFTAGYAVGQLPKLIQAAMLMIIAHLEANRGDEGFRTLPPSINMILDYFRIERL